ncbi:MAG: CBS domain-containing protein [Halobacteriovoraceae bacterium]|jgi:predicted transcriptional regulator|nr:CBS domain-containing protein [Halobacteriovoraceae bacterium]MBT5093170.1 CBS domain-containing protein [Halobacteriovoraceae bacterium]
MNPIGKLANEPFFQLDADCSISEAAQLMTEHKVGILVVNEKESMAGLISERDIIHKIVSKKINPEKEIVRDYMTSEIVTINECEEVTKAWGLMKSNHFRHLIVVNDNKYAVGMVSIKDILEFLSHGHEISAMLKDIDVGIS